MKSDNELIAEFMGARGKIIDGEYRIDYKQEGMKHFWSIPRYHTSWDWLMPVVEKIESLGYEVDIMRGVSIQTVDHFTKRIVKTGDSKIQSVYKAVVEFIKWYNENKTTP